MRHSCLPASLLGALALLAAVPAGAQAPAAVPPAAPAPAAAPKAGGPVDPIVAKVGEQEIRASDINEAAQNLPEQYRSMPPATLFSLLVDQTIDRKAVVELAKKQGLDKDPAVMRTVNRAVEQALQGALISRVVAPTLTEPAIRALYDKQYAGKTGEEEVHARHILVSNEADAIKIIAELKKGGDFAAIAKARSSDPGAAQGGDLGFFKRGDMLPEFAAAAFALKPGQLADKPVKTQYGWHVIKVEERRAAPPPSYEEVHDELRQKLIQEGVQKILADARAGVRLEKFNPDGTPLRATDTAQPPPPPAKK